MKHARTAYRACILDEDPPVAEVPWPLRTLAGHKLLAACARAIRAAGIRKIIMASVNRDETLRSAAQALGLKHARALEGAQDAEAPAIHQALACFLRDPDSRALLLLPVQMAMIQPASINALLRTHERLQHSNNPPPVLCPSFQGERGYPLLLPRHHVQTMLDASDTRTINEYLASLRSVRLRAHWLTENQPMTTSGYDLAELPLADIGLTWKVDSESALRKAEDYLRKTENRHLPGLEEATYLLTHAELPLIKMRHSVLVALGALRLGLALAKAQENPLPCDTPLLHVGAGLLHDIVRYQRRHAETGARLLLEMGWRKTALAAGRHQQLPPPCLAFLGLANDPRDQSASALPFPAQPDSCLLSATLCVNMADKYTQDDRQVPLETRFARVGRYCLQNPHTLAAVARRKEQTQAVAQGLRQCCADDPLVLLARPSGHALEEPLQALLRTLPQTLEQNKAPLSPTGV